MRGKGYRSCLVPVCQGITPACAGKSNFCTILGKMVEDHPRVCGEKRSRFKRDQNVKGSPPRVRGKVRRVVERQRPPGITPACAGKSAHRVRKSNSMRDHPRVCGEKVRICGHEIVSGGSPPRVRGKVLAAHPLFLILGITPACAGKSVCRRFSSLVRRDHPRVCGEKKLATFNDETGEGSPPRVRGKAVRVVALELRIGITPACAGKSTLCLQSVIVG